MAQPGEKETEDRNDPIRKENNSENQVYKNNQKITSWKENSVGILSEVLH